MDSGHTAEASLFPDFASLLSAALEGSVATNAGGDAVGRADIDTWIEQATETLQQGHCKIFFVGNGGSAAIASHMAVDFANVGGWRTLVLTDPSSLTCYANDYGYENAFSRQIEVQADKGDLLVAISSSGESPNMISAAAAARAAGCEILTLTGFASENALRQLGSLNIYVPSDRYDIVETCHHALCCAILKTAVHLREGRDVERA